MAHSTHHASVAFAAHDDAIASNVPYIQQVDRAGHLPRRVHYGDRVHNPPTFTRVVQTTVLPSEDPVAWRRYHATMLLDDRLKLCEELQRINNN